jgi:hypothetical protein
MIGALGTALGGLVAEFDSREQLMTLDHDDKVNDA